MNYDDFKAIINLMVTQSKNSRAAYKLGIDLMDFCETQNTLVNALWVQILTIEGKDWLDWFMYEKDYIEDGKINKSIQAWDEDGNEICKDLKGLYNYLLTQKYFKNYAKI